MDVFGSHERACDRQGTIESENPSESEGLALLP